MLRAPSRVTKPCETGSWYLASRKIGSAMDVIKSSTDMVVFGCDPVLETGWRSFVADSEDCSVEGVEDSGLLAGATDAACLD